MSCEVWKPVLWKETKPRHIQSLYKDSLRNILICPVSATLCINWKILYTFSISALFCSKNFPYWKTVSCLSVGQILILM